MKKINFSNIGTAMGAKVYNMSGVELPFLSEVVACSISGVVLPFLSGVVALSITDSEFCRSSGVTLPCL